jgi:hypothetical protein
MCKLEPAFVAVPSPLVATLTLEDLSKGVEYLEEKLAGETIDGRGRRHLIIVCALGFENIDQDIWSEWRIVTRTFSGEVPRVSGILSWCGTTPY